MNIFRFVFLCGVMFWLTCPTNADSVTLNSGEVISGAILSETSSNLTIETSNARRTIFSTRQIDKADIKVVERESEEQKREKADYESLKTYKTYQNQELTKEQYAAGISAFLVFLKDHPASTFATALSNRITAWQAESSNVESGLVKFANKWITPDEKAIQSIEWQKNQQAQSTQDTLGSLQEKLSTLQKTRAQVAANLAGAQGSLAAKQSQLANLQDKQVEIYRDRTVRAREYDNQGRRVYGGVDTTQRVPTGTFQTIPNPDRPDVAKSVATFQGQVMELQGTLAGLDASIKDLQEKINVARQAPQPTIIQKSQQPIKVQTQLAQNQPQLPTQQAAHEQVQDSTPPSPPVRHQAEPEEEPWLNRNWKLIGGIILGIVAVYAYSRLTSQ